MSSPPPSDAAPSLPPLWVSLLPAGALVALLFFSIKVLGSSGHIPLIAATAVAGLTGTTILKRPWRELEAGLIQSISHALPAILILMAVGLLIGVWIASGVVPLLIYYGLQILAPSYFLAAACAACALISLAIGSSWSTAATAGLALIGVGQALGVPEAMTAGAVVSGAYFGDKMSPLSDTTNLASATAGADLFEHIRHMLYTTMPALAIALSIYLFMGFQASVTGDRTAPAYLEMTQGLEGGFDLTVWLLAAPVVTLALIARRTSPLPALLAGVFVGCVLLLVFQPQNAPEGVGSVIAILYGGFQSHSGTAAVDELLSRGGLTSMLETIALIICAFGFGGVMEASGMLARLTQAILSGARSSAALVTATVLSGVGLNFLTADQYLAVVLPGRMYRAAYAAHGLHPKNLSRAIEDSATLTSPLVPWNTCGAYMASVLGVATFAYLPYAFLNLLGPVISIAYGLTGFTIEKIERTAPPKP
ncbi:MAG: Na+/H+ antiporter NhaC [Acidobacteria bacterium]|nr:Na+/H+ antiporter NhaC [Acidobacteriota bacterium]